MALSETLSQSAFLALAALIALVNAGMRGATYSETELRLQNACESGNLPFVKERAEREGAQSIVDYEWGVQGWYYTCLSVASQYGHADLVNFLLFHGDDPNEKPGNRESVLRLAYQRGHPGIVQRLIEAGADVNRPENYMERAQPLFWAVDDDNAAAARMFINAGADVNVISLRRIPATVLSGFFQNLFGSNTNFNVKDVNLLRPQSPIQSAIMQGRREVAQLLRDTGSLRVCAGRRNGDFMVDPANCCGYIRCLWPGTAWEAQVQSSCPPKTAWNEVSRNCVASQYAQCAASNEKCKIN